MNDGRIEQMGEPTQLYENPVTTFVANFLGQSNLVRGTVTGRSGGDLLLEVQGRQMAMPSARSATTSSEVWVGVRPEKLRVTSDMDAPITGNCLDGTVSDASFMGISTHYLVQTAWGQELTVVQQNDGTAPLASGSQVRLNWEAEHTFALDAAQDAHAGEQRVDSEDGG
jgi:spermidine/putrescine transport system ATP-binding protein